jgi:hypothetical protein
MRQLSENRTMLFRLIGLAVVVMGLIVLMQEVIG